MQVSKLSENFFTDLIKISHQNFLMGWKEKIASQNFVKREWKRKKNKN
jgi:hypothetical protein